MSTDPTPDQLHAALPSAHTAKCTAGTVWQLVRFFMSEFLGTALLCFVAVLLPADNNCHATAPFVVALTFMVMAAALGPITGGQINPVVTFALLLTRRLSILHTGVFWVAQFLGAIAGAWVGISVGAGQLVRTTYIGMTIPSPTISIGQAVALEIIATVILLCSILAAADEFRTDQWGGNIMTMFPFVLGVTQGLLVAIVGPYTGASMNTARSLGPAILNGHYENQWIYFVGPFTGALLATIIYECLLSEGASLPRIRAWLTHAHFDRTKDYTLRSQAKVINDA